MPSGWHAHNSKILAIDLYSMGSIEQETMNFIKIEKISAFIKSNESES